MIKTELSMQNNFGFNYDEFIKIDNETNLKEKIDKCLNYLSRLEPTVFINDKLAYKLIAYLSEHSENNRYLIASLLDKPQIIQTIVDLFEFYKSELKQLLKVCSPKTNHEDISEDYLKKSHEKFQFVHEILNLICNLTNQSKRFCYKFHDSRGSEVLLKYLDDSVLVRKLLKFKRKHSDSIEEIGCSFIRTFITSFYNISSIAEFRKNEFEILNVTNIIRKLADLVASENDARITSYLILSNVICDQEIESLPCTKEALKAINELIKEASNMIADTENPVFRLLIDTDPSEDVEKMEEVCHLESGWNIVELFNGLYRLAINDKIKCFIFNDLNIMDELKKIIYYGNHIEVEYSLKLLWQLCFDKEIANALHDDEILDYIETLHKKRETSKSIKHYSEGILWSEKKSTEEYEAKMYESQKGHIMISYNSFSRDLCLKIKSELENLGYTIWIDVERIHGSSLEAMAKAIEDSECVLMCMTEKYKLSPNCRAEAEYAFRIGTPIVPLIMQQDYMPDGWLGIILGSKIFINFTKYPFDECMRRLLIELKPLDILEENGCKTVEIPIAKTNVDAKPDVKSWTNDDVQKWLSKFNFHEDIKKVITKFDGEKLTSLNSIRLKAPEYFYKSLSLDNQLSLDVIVEFNCKFEKLFE